MKRRHITMAGVAGALVTAIVLAGLMASHARGNTGTPSDCAQTALAAMKAVHLDNLEHHNFHERQFIEASRYLWIRSGGNKELFLEWYRDACEVRRLPGNVRIEEGRVVMRSRA